MAHIISEIIIIIKTSFKATFTAGKKPGLNSSISKDTKSKAAHNPKPKAHSPQPKAQ